jgi:hypothetical protein
MVGCGTGCRTPDGLVRVEDLAVEAELGRVDEDRVDAWTAVDPVRVVGRVTLPHVDRVAALAAGDDVDVRNVEGVGDGVI